MSRIGGSRAQDHEVRSMPLSRRSAGKQAEPAILQMYVDLLISHERIAMVD